MEAATNLDSTQQSPQTEVLAPLSVAGRVINCMYLHSMNAPIGMTDAIQSRRWKNGENRNTIAVENV
jgi:hypothetical protein